jgi:hypothetical protein
MLTIRAFLIDLYKKIVEEPYEKSYLDLSYYGLPDNNILFLLISNPNNLSNLFNTYNDKYIIQTIDNIVTHKNMRIKLRDENIKYIPSTLKFTIHYEKKHIK